MIDERPSFDNSEPSHEPRTIGIIIFGVLVFIIVAVWGTMFYFYVYKPNKAGEWTRALYQFTYSDGTMIRKTVMENPNPRYRGLDKGCTYGIEPKQCYVREAVKLELNPQKCIK